MIDLKGLPQIITAIGGLGTAAFGLVEATKVFGGGVNRIGFKRIATAVGALLPQTASTSNGLSKDKMLDTLKANWYNGTDLASQKSIAKSLIKLNLSGDNAAKLAEVTGVSSDTLTTVARKMTGGDPLEPGESDVLGRFDLIVTALLDEAYQHGDQVYRNGTRAWAVVASVVLALAGGIILHYAAKSETLALDIAGSLLVGLLATPLAPIAKDLSTALATAVNTLQLVRK
jgi:hypothetical protein